MSRLRRHHSHEAGPARPGRKDRPGHPGFLLGDHERQLSPNPPWKVPVFNTGFATTAAAASGLRAALDLRGDTETTVVGWAGDGGTFDIGFQALSAAAERGEDFIYVCYDNEAYMNTGVQRSSSTPWGARTKTTPGTNWKHTEKKNIVEIMARAPHTLRRDGKHSLSRGSRAEDQESDCRCEADCASSISFPHVLRAGEWRPRIQSIVARMAVQSRAFPLYEVEDGLKYTINEAGDKPVKDYLRSQSRFRHLSDEDIGIIQERLDIEYGRLVRKTLAES